MARAWFQCVGVDASAADDVERRLVSAGINLTSRDDAREPVGNGALLFDGDEEAAIEALEFCRRGRLARVVVVTARQNLATPGLAWRLRAAGAADVLACDDARTAPALAARLDRWSAVDALLTESRVRENSVGRSPQWTTLLQELVEVAAFTTASVVLIGESGTGKEHLAQLIHTLDRRPEKGQLVTVDCTTIVPELSGSEFFGHERGAFTGAFATRDGAVAHASGGTIFLDEVGELPMGLQAQLLRVVQEGMYKRVGGNDWLKSRFRLVCATNVNLSCEVQEKRFRLDFYHRIGSWVFRVPPLRERPEDIISLAKHFMAAYLPPGSDIEMDGAVEQLLLRRSYPGNVRELKALVGRLCGRHVGQGPFTVGDIPVNDLEAADVSSDRGLEEAAGHAALTGVGLKEIGRVARDAAIRTALAATAENVQSASKLLKVTDRALQLELAKREN